MKLFDADGKRIELGTDAAEEDAVTGIRRTTLDAPLNAIYGNVNRLDAFVGMVSERRRTPAQIIRRNSDATVQDDVFEAPEG